MPGGHPRRAVKRREGYTPARSLLALAFRLGGANYEADKARRG